MRGAGRPAPPAGLAVRSPVIRLPRLLPLVIALLGPFAAEAHDPSAWGGLFRSRDLGARWLPVSDGRFIGGALDLAIDPSDPSHMLLATDSGLLRSRNGGRDWQVEAPSVLAGAVFAVAFAGGGERAIASTGRALFRADGAGWHTVPIPSDALPAQAIAVGAPGRAYLAGAGGVWRTDDAGASWTPHGDGLPDGPAAAVIVAPGSPEVVWAVAGGRLWRRAEADRAWEAADTGLPEGRVDALALDAVVPGRVWAAAADQVYRSDHGGRGWAPVGRPLPEPGTSV
ncbi:MAG TPA: hypothetical protein VEL75_01310, partial [Candidatus Methylomirabilis sp.]|nr:hypothetical protein [Candidatus Methylomirabilis sp.]